MPEIGRIMSIVNPDADQALLSEQTSENASERRLLRLTYDLHDGPLQDVAALAEDLRLAASQIAGVVPDADKARVRGRFLDIESRLEALEESLREIAHGGRSAGAVGREPIEEAVRGELAALDDTGIVADFRSEGDFEELTDSQKIALLRVVQEGLTNVRKHSGARSVSVVLRGLPEAMELTIRDDGHGFDVRALGRDRLGLAGVSERIHMLGGEVEIESFPEKGATLWARLPRWRPPTTDVN